MTTIILVIGLQMENLMKKLMSDFTPMSKEDFERCLNKVNVEQFSKDPTKALNDAGITFRKGVTCQFVETEEESHALPANVIPLKRPELGNKQLSKEDLDKVAGGGLGAAILNGLVGGIPGAINGWNDTDW